ncbi:MAG: hypothetical protein M1832_001478 [Thelocarpon impressellum]|nr:MAG: hypothetical protein M1832_001478 [Thelocarpon impressellum]
MSSGRKENASSGGGAGGGAPRHRFTMASLRGMQQPELSKKLFRLIKSENHVIGSYESASRERISVASQLSEWGEATGDDAVSEISDKLGVLLSELGEQENSFAENLEEYRGILKQIRNTESSVQPSRDHKAKVADELQKLKYKDPQNPKTANLEQELVRAEAENLVAEAQLTNIVRLHLLAHRITLTPAKTRQKLKQAYDILLAAVIERGEKQILLARHGRRVLNLLDDTPVVPGDVRPSFDAALQTRQILNDAEDELREWRPSVEPIQSSAGLQQNLMPAEETQQQQLTSAPQGESEYGGTVTSGTQSYQQGEEGSDVAHRGGHASGRIPSGSTASGAPYPASEVESHSALV